MTVQELIDKLTNAATGTTADVTEVTINGGHSIRRVDVYNKYIDLTDDTKEETHSA